MEDGCPSSAVVLRTIKRLVDVGKDFGVVMVVRPDGLEYLAAGMVFLRSLGVRRVEPSLDLWCCWTPEDAARLEEAVVECARVWRDGIPGFSVTWFDEKVARMAGLPVADSARCGFGDGEVAVAPSGRLYPCERLIREDAETNPMRLPGDVLDGDDFLDAAPPPCLHAESCQSCTIRSMCNTTCRCSNYVRTGDAATPDGLLCLLNRVCVRETARALELMCRGAGV
jgi:radical SAM protein with 4Fe4S-binding SPASM domain